MSIIDELINRLGDDADCHRVASGILIERWEGESFSPALRFRITEETLTVAIQNFTSKSAGSFGGKSATETAGWNLFFVSLFEAIETRRKHETELVVEGTTIRTYAPTE
jgi:hypothetical protein